MVSRGPMEDDRPMAIMTSDRQGVDRWAIFVSGLCVVHCLSGAVFIALAASAGGLLLDPIVHEIGLAIAIVLGVIAIGRGIWRHGYALPAAVGSLGIGTMAGALSLPHGEMEIVYTILGVALLALGHDLNRRAYR